MRVDIEAIEALVNAKRHTAYDTEKTLDMIASMVPALIRELRALRAGEDVLRDLVGMPGYPLAMRDRAAAVLRALDASFDKRTDTGTAWEAGSQRADIKALRDAQWDSPKKTGTAGEVK